MTKITKRLKTIVGKIEPNKIYAVEEAIKLLQECPKLKFVETVEVCINLGIDPRKSEQMVRGSAILPNGTGRKVKVAVFAQDEQAKAAKEAGADRVGFEDLVESIKGGDLDYDVIIATPDAMRMVGQLGQILGPKGLMPNPKVGTVSANVAEAVKNAKTGQVRFRTDKNGIIHCSIGKLNFTVSALKENLVTLLAELKKAKPAGTKGTYIEKITLTSTMGPGLVLDLTTI